MTVERSDIQTKLFRCESGIVSIKIAHKTLLMRCGDIVARVVYESIWLFLTSSSGWAWFVKVLQDNSQVCSTEELRPP